MAIPPTITVASWAILALSVVGNTSIRDGTFGVDASETGRTRGANIVGKIHGGVVVRSNGRAISVLSNWSHTAVVSQVAPLVSRAISL